MASTDQEYRFVEQPSKDFFCPVTYGLLLEPHLTACCGKHLSQEATARIQGERGACPLCKESHFSTVLNKHFLRQVHELHVLCRHENRGCGWQGELSDLERHMQSCPMKTAPLISSGTREDMIGHQVCDVLRPPSPQGKGCMYMYQRVGKLSMLGWCRHDMSTFPNRMAQNSQTRQLATIHFRHIHVLYKCFCTH